MAPVLMTLSDLQAKFQGLDIIQRQKRKRYFTWFLVKKEIIELHHGELVWRWYWNWTETDDTESFRMVPVLMTLSYL